MTFNELLLAFLAGAAALRRSEGEEPEAEPIPTDDPRRDPNWCWQHNMLWPACAGMH